MEKLQQALEQARMQRTMSKSETRAVHQPAPTAWAALKPFDPDPKRLERHRLVSATANPNATPFDILRTKVTLTMRKNNWRRLAVTSATINSGKTTIATNLALGFSRQPDINVILFEFDLRRPRIAETLNISPELDISEMLSGKISFAEQAFRYRENVAVSVARQRVEDPTAVLLNPKTHETLAQIEAEYAPEFTIFDLPPLLAGDDTRALLKDVDCVLVVARAQATTIAQIDSCEREIAEHTNVLGVVVNQDNHDPSVMKTVY